jgi:hypothetical protein
MHNGIMTYRNIIADMNFGFLIGGMNDDSILDIHLVADMNAVDVSSHHRIEPDTTFIAHLHIPYHCGIGGEKTVFAEARRFAFYW